MSIEEKIIIAAITCMDKKGIQSVTTRDITREAEVNTAAINYYFRSKDNLMQKALKYSMKQAFEDISNLDKDSGEELDVRMVFQHFLSGALRYPGLTRSHLYKGIMENDYSGAFVREFNVFLENFFHKIKSRFNNLKEMELKMRIVAVFNSILFASLMPGGFSDFSGMDFSDTTYQADYVELLEQQFFNVK